jgi:hypothetical protein
MNTEVSTITRGPYRCTHERWRVDNGWCTCLACGDGWPDENRNQDTAGIDRHVFDEMVHAACSAFCGNVPYPGDFGAEEQVQMQTVVRPIVLAAMKALQHAGTAFPFTIVVDERIPPGEMHVRDGGKLVLRIVGLGGALPSA